MTRYDFGGDGTQAILDLTTSELLVSATGGVVYASLTAVTPLADITADLDGTTFLDFVSTDDHGIPVRFYGPDDVQQVAVDFGSGDRFLLDSARGRYEALHAGGLAAAADIKADDAIATAGASQITADEAKVLAQDALDGVGGADGSVAMIVALEARTTADAAQADLDILHTTTVQKTDSPVWVAGLDGSGNPTVTLFSPWGIDSLGDPYYDPAGAADGEAADFVLDLTGNLNLVTPEA